MLFFHINTSSKHLGHQRAVRITWTTKQKHNHYRFYTQAICTRTLRIKHWGITIFGQRAPTQLHSSSIWCISWCILPKLSLLLSHGDEGPEQKWIHWIVSTCFKRISNGNDVTTFLKFGFINDKSPYIELEHGSQTPSHPIPVAGDVPSISACVFTICSPSVHDIPSVADLYPHS